MLSATLLLRFIWLAQLASGIFPPLSTRPPFFSLPQYGNYQCLVLGKVFTGLSGQLKSDSGWSGLVS